MGIFEIDLPATRWRHAMAGEACPIAVTQDRLALSARPEFLVPSDGPSGAVQTLWDRLSLSWRDPQLARDMVGG